MTERANTQAMKMHNIELEKELEKLCRAIEDNSLTPEEKQEVRERIGYIKAERQETVYVDMHLFNEVYPYEVLEIVSPSTFKVRQINRKLEKANGQYCFNKVENGKVITIRRSHRRGTVFREPGSNSSSLYKLVEKPYGNKNER